MKVIFKVIDHLLAKPDALNLTILDKVLRVGIPFNAPHGFKIKKIDQENIVISLPNKKLNHNHLGGVHACAMATVGEFCAGLSLLKTFGISKYRLILSELSVKYFYQGRTDLEGNCSPTQIDIEGAKRSLESDGKYLQSLTTMIRDLNGKEVAEVSTMWQLKAWDQVKTKT
jgi:acyl-coenzyme A thioesterase PaaI-like protein